MFENQDSLSSLVTLPAYSTFVLKEKKVESLEFDRIFLINNKFGRLTDGTPFHGHFSVSAVFPCDRHLRHSHALLYQNSSFLEGNRTRIFKDKLLHCMCVKFHDSQEITNHRHSISSLP